MPHKDGPLYAPRVCVLSLGASCVVDFCALVERDERMQLVRVASLVLQPRSLLVFQDNAYHVRSFFFVYFI